MPSGIDVTRADLLNMSHVELGLFMAELENTKALVKNSYIIELVQTASPSELEQLEHRRRLLSPIPEEGDIWFKLDQAINIKRYVQAVENGNYFNVSSLWGLKEASLHCFKDLIFPLSERASQQIVHMARVELDALKFLEFNGKLQRMTGAMTSDGEHQPPILSAFNKAAESVREGLETVEPVPQTNKDCFAYHL